MQNIILLVFLLLTNLYNIKNSWKSVSLQDRTYFKHRIIYIYLCCFGKYPKCSEEVLFCCYVNIVMLLVPRLSNWCLVVFDLGCQTSRPLRGQSALKSCFFPRRSLLDLPRQHTKGFRRIHSMSCLLLPLTLQGQFWCYGRLLYKVDFG